MDDRLPYFPFYTHDWLSGRAVQVMTCAQRGAFIHLLAHAWQSTPPCTLPDDDTELAALSGMGAEEWATAGRYVRAQFHVVEGGLRNPKQWRVFCDWRRFRAQKAKAGRASGRTRNTPRTDDEQTTNRRSTQREQTANTPRTDGQHNANKIEPSSSSSSSLSSSLETHDARARGKTTPAASGEQRGRIYLHRWQIEALIATLGSHSGDFGLDEWIDGLTTLLGDRVLPASQVWPWVQAELAAEAARRGLPVASVEAPVAPSKRTLQMQAGMRAFLAGGDK